MEILQEVKQLDDEYFAIVGKNKPVAKKTFYIDGGCSNNSQKDISRRKMVSVVCDEAGNVIYDISNEGGSNNIAELIALQYVLLWATTHKLDDIKIITDSKNTIAWYNSTKINRKINDYARTSQIKKEIDLLEANIGKIEIEWRGREDNKAGHYIKNKYNL